jgi:hypothetical protein
MVVTVVLHLLAAQLESGELVGHAEHVATGIRYPVRSSADVIALCRQAAQSPELGSVAAPRDVRAAAPDNDS